jgi:adenine specific DNA methylase Mod
LITALKNNEIKITSDEKEKIMDALTKALKNLTQKHDNKLDVSSNVNSTRNS